MFRGVFIPLVNLGYLIFWHSVGLALLDEATIQLDCFIVFSSPPSLILFLYAKCLFWIALRVECLLWHR